MPDTTTQADAIPPEEPAGRLGLRPGDQIGRYHLLGILGEGGFGVVFEAEQREPVCRRVALKIIKPGMDSASVLARFDAERQALAVMDHPCIAKIFDGGVTGPEFGSRPFFVMELVKGVPITEHCDRQRLTISDRCSLFTRVCHAVQHAHTKGVIHRDLKPSNILVGYDENGVANPKVIDFGVAKALNQRLAAATVFTEQGQIIGTPEYMSPEQAEMSGQDIDTRSDVYSLGVLLYELLTGELPFDRRSLREAALAEIQRIIREVDPPRPSTRLSTAMSSAADGERIVKARRADAQVLTNLLRRDLDWVVMRCLEKERERRYPTPAAVADEVKRYLNNEPLEARPPSVRYRLQKHAVRNRRGVSVAAILVAVLVLVLSIYMKDRRDRWTTAATQQVAMQQAEYLLGRADGLLSSLIYAPPQSFGEARQSQQVLYALHLLRQSPPRYQDLIGRDHQTVDGQDYANWLRTLGASDWSEVSDDELIVTLFSDGPKAQVTLDEARDWTAEQWKAKAPNFVRNANRIVRWQVIAMRPLEWRGEGWIARTAMPWIGGPSGRRILLQSGVGDDVAEGISRSAYDLGSAPEISPRELGESLARLERSLFPSGTYRWIDRAWPRAAIASMLIVPVVLGATATGRRTRLAVVLGYAAICALFIPESLLSLGVIFKSVVVRSSEYGAVVALLPFVGFLLTVALLGTWLWVSRFKGIILMTVLGTICGAVALLFGPWSVGTLIWLIDPSRR